MRTPQIALSIALFSLPVHAGGGGEEAVLIVDPTNPEALETYERYKSMKALLGP